MDARSEVLVGLVGASGMSAFGVGEFSLSVGVSLSTAMVIRTIWVVSLGKERSVGGGM